MKKFVVELSITKTFTTQVVVQGDYQDRNDPAINKKAKLAADNMDHEKWDYKDTEFEINNIISVPVNFDSLTVLEITPSYTLYIDKRDSSLWFFNGVEYRGIDIPDLYKQSFEINNIISVPVNFDSLTALEVSPSYTLYIDKRDSSLRFFDGVDYRGIDIPDLYKQLMN